MVQLQSKLSSTPLHSNIGYGPSRKLARGVGKSIHLEGGGQGEEVVLEAGERADGGAPHRGTLSPPRPPQEETMRRRTPSTSRALVAIGTRSFRALGRRSFDFGAEQEKKGLLILLNYIGADLSRTSLMQRLRSTQG
jgi:hypothetical protein